jgi:thiol-disulfide isomerase/thioredoxin
VWTKVWDALAALVIAFALWKIFIAPRWLHPPGAFPAPHAVFERLDGGSFRIADQRGRVVFLEFFASWCEPCKIEMPLVERWSQQHQDALVVPIDVGEQRTIAAAFAREHALTNVALDPHATSRAFFAVQGFPTVVVIDPTGHIRAKWEGLNPAIGLAMTNALTRL